MRANTQITERLLIFDKEILTENLFSNQFAEIYLLISSFVFLELLFYY